MPRDLILHIGTSKTGSTSIQHMLDANRSALLKNGICYPETPGGKSHILLASAFTSFPNMYKDADNSLWLGSKPELAIEKHLASLATQISRLPPSVHRIILSCEQFGMYQRTEADVRRLHDFVHSVAETCTVVVYLRRQDEHFASLYSQFLRLGNIGIPDMGRLHQFHQDYDYAAFMARWAIVFGHGRMMPRIFERGISKRFDVIEDFAELCGIDLARMTTGGEITQNQSMNLAGQETLRQVGSLLQKKYDTRQVAGLILWQRITEAVSDTAPGKGWVPTQAQAGAFMERYAASNEAVRASWFPDKTSLFNLAYDNLPEQAPAAPVDAVQATTMEALVAALQVSLKREISLNLDKARLAHRLGDAKLRRVSLAQAVRLDAKDVNARLRFVECLADQGDLGNARQHFGIASKLAPKHPELAGVRRKLLVLEQELAVSAAHKPQE